MSCKLPASTSSTKQSRLKIAHINIRSLRNKIHEIATLLHRHQLDILAITESCLDQSVADSTIAIQSYNFYRRDRCGRKGGGVIFYIHAHLRTQGLTISSTLEALFVSVSISRTNPTLVVGCIYRPPDTPVDFWRDLDHVVRGIMNTHPDTILLGDFNVNTLAQHPLPNNSHISKVFAMTFPLSTPSTNPLVPPVTLALIHA